MTLRHSPNSPTMSNGTAQASDTHSLAATCAAWALGSDSHALIDITWPSLMITR
jgi:hypothetical protein